jgi:hypothetical protein
MEPFGCANKPTEKQCWLIYCERKILFRLKNKMKKTDYKPNEQDQCFLDVSWRITSLDKVFDRDSRYSVKNPKRL